MRNIGLSLICLLLIGEPLAAQEPKGNVPIRRAPAAVVQPTAVRATKSYFVEPTVGGGATYEFSNSAYAKVGVKGRYYISREVNVGFNVSDSIYSQMYLTTSPADLWELLVLGKRLDVKPVWVTEQKIEAETHVRYRIPVGKSPLSVYPLVGLKGIFLQNGAFNSSMAGINAGLELGYALGGAWSLEAGGDFLYDLLGLASRPAIPLLLGSPWGAATYGASLGYRLNPQYRLRVGYDGQAIFFQNITRLYNGLIVSLIF